MGILSTLRSARTGLNAASVALDATANNVSNASTPGYSRRSVRLTNMDPVRSGSTYRGAGVAVEGVDRAADIFVSRQLIGATGDQSLAEAEFEVLGLTESWFNDAEIDGLPTMLQSVYDSLTQATQDPSDETLRRGVGSASKAFADSLSRTAVALVDLEAQVQSRIEGELDEANQRVRAIADLNRAIIGTGGAAADLLDQRDREVSALAELVGVDYHIESDGSATVLLGGHALVTGIEGRELSAEMSAGEAEIFIDVDQGRTQVTQELSGRIGGMITGLDRVEGYLDDLDLFVEEIQTQFNDQHALGFDRGGAAGGEWFQTATGGEHLSESFAFSSAIDADPDLFAFAANASASAGDGENLRVFVEQETEEVFSGSISGEGSLLKLLSTVGEDTATAQRLGEQQAVILGDLQGLQDTIAGVDLDEEAGKLIEFQASYQAAAKVLRMSTELFDSLMQAML